MGWTVQGLTSGEGEIIRTCLDRPWGPPILLYNGYRVFPGGKERPWHDADPSPPSSAMVMKGYSYTSTTPIGCTAYREPQCLYKGALYLYLLQCILTVVSSLQHQRDKNVGSVPVQVKHLCYSFRPSWVLYMG